MTAAAKQYNERNLECARIWLAKAEELGEDHYAIRCSRRTIERIEEEDERQRGIGLFGKAAPIVPGVEQDRQSETVEQGQADGRRALQGQLRAVEADAPGSDYDAPGSD